MESLRYVVEDTSDNEYLKETTIQRFEYTYELAWKACKQVLEEKGMYLLFPTDIFKEAFSAGWLQNAKVGKEMIKARNTTSHLYDEEATNRIVIDIKNKYYQELRYLQNQLGVIIDARTDT